MSELDAKLAAMWKGSSAAIELTDVVDGTRTDLFERFSRDPLARHDLEVQALVSGVRGSARIPRLVLARVAGGGWLVTEIGARRGDAPRIVSPQVFDDLRDAERFVFSLRLALLGSLKETQSLPNGFVVPAGPAHSSSSGEKEASALPWVKTVIGYPSEWSVAPGQSVGFHVSGTGGPAGGAPGGGSYRASVHRLLGGGLAPSAPQLASEVVADLGAFPLLDQPVQPGSYGIAPLTADLAAGTLVVTFMQTRAAGEQVLIAIGAAGPDDAPTMDSGTDSASRSGGDAGDAIVLGLRDGVPFLAGVAVSSALNGASSVPLDTWVTLVASWGHNDATLWAANHDGGSLGALWPSQRSTMFPRLPSAAASFVIGAATEPGTGFARHFSGRIERPALLSEVFEAHEAVALVGVPGAPVPSEAVALWELSEGITGWTVPGHGPGAGELTLHQAPLRGVRGSTWTENATSWREDPHAYGAIHFYPDSLEDCEWVEQASWVVPEGARSGFYALRAETVAADGASRSVEPGGADGGDWIPFFVRPAAGAPGARLAVLASTATYAAYGNSRFWWEDPIQEIAQDRLVELGPEEQYLVTHPELAPSNYDVHLDDTMVVFSSRRRPNLFMRPGHSRYEAYASDLYLIAWLEHLGLDYDVFTDEDLHFAGGDLLAPYSAVISSSHPEYLSVVMHDAIRGWVEAGGRFLYLGGNGWTSDVTWHPERPWLMENRTTGRMRVTDAAVLAAEASNQGDGEKGGHLADIGRSPGSLFGVDTSTMGFDRSYPVQRSAVSYDPAFAWAFEGIPGRLFGGRSLSGGGVIGQEWDNARLVPEGTSGHYVLASSIDHSLIPAILGSDVPYHGDVVIFFHASGVVVSASAMAWVGALHVNGYDNDAERFAANLVTRFLDPAPITAPAASQEAPPASAAIL